MPKGLKGFQTGRLNPSYGKHPYNYKGGTITRSGSRKIDYLETKINGKRVKLHRYIMEQKLKRALSPIELVHHKNGNGLDNRIENLKITNQQEHKRLHKERVLNA